ncbi:MAG TPA: Sec-independent protein translocase subunit TatA [Jatrophihabitantaceae bacterium]|jgi:sec-independent protein translocase protein TatA
MGWDAPWHWVVLAILVLLLFGYKKLPDASRSLGRSLRIFKTEIKGMNADDKARAEADDQAETEPKALPPADVVKREASTDDAQRSRPRPSPSK